MMKIPACCIALAWMVLPAHGKAVDRFFDGDRYRVLETPHERIRGRPRAAKRMYAKRAWKARKVRAPRVARKPQVSPPVVSVRNPALDALALAVDIAFAPFGAPVDPEQAAIPPAAVADRPRTLKEYLGEFRPLKSLYGFPEPLQRMVGILQTQCGARITSAYRPGARVAGSGRPSLHASKRAVDLQGNPSCLYAKLKQHRYAGGYSTDYRAVNHLHMSWGGREHGARFAHYSRPSRIRLASR